MSQQRETDSITECPICLESFTETGSRVPRLLPCSHSLCEQCVKKNFEAEDTELSRMQNTSYCRKWGEKVSTKQVHFKYAETHTTNHQTPQEKGKKSTPAKNLKEPNKICYAHKKDLILYCKRDGCLKEICQMCKMKGHKGHLVVSIEEERSAKVKELEYLSGRIRIYRTQLLVAKRKVRDEGEYSLKRLRKRKHEQIKIYDDLIKQMQNGIKEN